MNHEQKVRGRIKLICEETKEVLVIAASIVIPVSATIIIALILKGH